MQWCKVNNNKDNIKLYNWLLISLTYGVGGTSLLRLIERFGSIDAVLAASVNELMEILPHGVAKLVHTRSSEPNVVRALEWLNSGEMRHIITLDDERYPESLAEIASPPPLLFAFGDINLLKMPKIAIVGTRNPSQHGIENSAAFARDLANNGLAVVSGMAGGVDHYAHKGVLNAKGATIGVLGTGIDLIYPKSNRVLFQQMYNSGLLLSEFPLGTAALSQNFPRRNRIISGLSLGCLVIESAIDGGSMISANFALEMGREVFAIPGSIHNPVARGCHKLLKQGAKLVETANDVLEELKLIYKPKNIIQDDENTDPLLHLMGFDAISIDKLSENSRLDFAELCAKLLEFELDGKIVNCGHGRYQRIFN